MFGCLIGPSHRDGLLTPKSYVFAGIKEILPAQKSHNVVPSTARQQYAISMAYRWWAVDGPTLCASWVETLCSRAMKKSDNILS